MVLPPGHGVAPRSAAALSVPSKVCSLFAGTLPLKCCAVRFASWVPTWRLPVSGHAACQVTAEGGVAGVEVGGEGGLLG